MCSKYPLMWSGKMTKSAFKGSVKNQVKDLAKIYKLLQEKCVIFPAKQGDEWTEMELRSGVTFVALLGTSGQASKSRDREVNDLQQGVDVTSTSYYISRFQVTSEFGKGSSSMSGEAEGEGDSKVKHVLCSRVHQ